MEQNTSSDAASIRVSHNAEDSHHIALHELVNLARHLKTPVEHFGLDFEHLVHLSSVKNRNGEPVVSAATLAIAQVPVRNAIWLDVRDKNGTLQQRILDKNCTTNVGETWSSILMGGDINANIGYENHAGAGAFTATTVTPTASPAWTTNQWSGHICVAMQTASATATLVFGVILSNTATALTIDQWTAVGSTTGASTTTPAANCSFIIVQGQGPAYWLALSTDTTVEDIGNTTLLGEFTANFSTVGRWKGVYAQTTVPSGTGTANSTSVFTLDPGVLTCTTGVTVARMGLFNAQNGGIIVLSKKLATAATLAINDTLDPKWTVTRT